MQNEIITIDNCGLVGETLQHKRYCTRVVFAASKLMANELTNCTTTNKLYIYPKTKYRTK